jgi:tripeptidyl-peptidase II
MPSQQDYWSGLLPKDETQASEFLRDHPEFDGRGIVVGVLDTGVDPGAIGLQLTSDGRPKVIDVVDCSGSGDVIMSKAVRVDTEGCLPGVGGRKLLVDPSWRCPSGEFRIGIKRIFEIYPEGVTHNT